jgi:hypothetical protein
MDKDLQIMILKLALNEVEQRKVLSMRNASDIVNFCSRHPEEIDNAFTEISKQKHISNEAKLEVMKVLLKLDKHFKKGK